MALRVGRYVLHHEIASGGMARVYFGRMLGPSGFGRVVAIKRMFPQYASDPEFAAMFLDEAKLAARVQHPNVAATLDVASTDEGELLQVMEYVPGEALSRLVKKLGGDAIPLDVISAILCDALHGLHAAHEATDENGEPMHLVHRDVSPQNLLVGSDGHTRVLDFGVAKAAGRLHTTKDGRVKGKIAYMSPEQLRGETIDRRADIYSAGIVLWELLTGDRLFMADSEGETAVNALERVIDAPSKHREGIAPALDALVLRALARDRTKRFTTARQMAIALEEHIKPASARRVGEWVEEVAGDILRTRGKTIVELEALKTPEQEQERSSASVEVTPSRSGKKIEHALADRRRRPPDRRNGAGLELAPTETNERSATAHANRDDVRTRTRFRTRRREYDADHAGRDSVGKREHEAKDCATHDECRREHECESLSSPQLRRRRRDPAFYS